MDVSMASKMDSCLRMISKYMVQDDCVQGIRSRDEAAAYHVQREDAFVV